MASYNFTEDELRYLYVEKRLSLSEIAHLKGCHRETIRRHLILRQVSRRSVSEAMIKYPKTNFSGDPREKAYLIGFGAGDLHVYQANHSETSQTIIVACGSTMREQIDLIRSLFEVYGGVHQSSGEKQTVITCYLDLSFGFLLGKEDRIADWILADQSCFAAYLAGYIDAEGCIQVKQHTRAAEVVIRSYQVNILRTCHTILQELGIVCPPVYLAKGKGQRNAKGPLYHQDYWGLGICSRQSLFNLFTLIDPFLKHAKRRRDMQIAWDNVRTRLSA